ncbi:hypothetical protein RFI_12124 [Reticulomyxa filosa]|uniref:Uncharacterized protein n=1 Tax=Reticulomyxa filosa TaxID=46433 RepID=X6NGA8_RETFI|nr:hypothetical protein RFI_12124 [Reticulomyxa filosa]|eukprot:ETO25021.1 hypothetical protein RFI_12124 [Reticulomyxa filosa]
MKNNVLQFEMIKGLCKYIAISCCNLQTKILNGSNKLLMALILSQSTKIITYQYISLQFFFLFPLREQEKNYKKGRRDASKESGASEGKGKKRTKSKEIIWKTLKDYKRTCNESGEKNQSKRERESPSRVPLGTNHSSSCLSGPNNPKTILRKQRQEHDGQCIHPVAIAGNNSTNNNSNNNNNIGLACHSQRPRVTFDDNVTVFIIPYCNHMDECLDDEEDTTALVPETSGKCCLIQ